MASCNSWKPQSTPLNDTIIRFRYSLSVGPNTVTSLSLYAITSRYLFKKNVANYTFWMCAEGVLTAHVLIRHMDVVKCIHYHAHISWFMIAQEEIHYDNRFLCSHIFACDIQTNNSLQHFPVAYTDRITKAEWFCKLGNVAHWSYCCTSPLWHGFRSDTQLITSSLRTNYPAVQRYTIYHYILMEQMCNLLQFYFSDSMTVQN